MRRVSAEQAVNLIADHDALVKVINDTKAPFTNDDILLDARWKYHIDDLKDPFATRKVNRTRLKEKGLVKVVCRPGDAEAVVIRGKDPDLNVNPATGQAYTHTLKTALSLLPRNGRMKVYAENSFPLVGLVYNCKACDLRGERYIWADDASTSGKWWKAEVDPQAPSIGDPVSRTMQSLKGATEGRAETLPLAQVRKLQITARATPSYNEVLAGVSKDSVYAVFFSLQDCASNEVAALATRLVAQSRRKLVKTELQAEVPILHIRDDDKVVVYTDSDAGADRSKVKTSKDLATKVALHLAARQSESPDAQVLVQALLAKLDQLSP